MNPMNFKHSISAAVLLFFLLLGPLNARGQEPYLRDMEVQLLQWINVARSQPLLMAWFLGMDPNQVMTDLPLLHDILTHGIGPLRYDDILTNVARSHTQEMIDFNYYGNDSLDGKTAETRILEAGYFPDKTGESLGMLGFFNFIDPSPAVLQIFTTMYKDELNPARTRPRNILNPVFQDIGVGFGAGMLTLERTPYNVYLVTCDFGKSAVSVPEMELLEMINQAREKPLDMAEALGMNRDEVLAGLPPEMGVILTQGLPPLTLNQRLYASARDHAVDMIQNSYNSTVSLGGRTVQDRVREKGYDPVLAGEAIRMLSTVDQVNISDAARTCFEKLFRSELSAAGTNLNILNPFFKEVGVSFITRPAGANTDQEGTYGQYNIAMLVCDLGLSAGDNGSPYVKGRVYTDLDGNGLYSLGEGTGGIALRIQGPETGMTIYTNPAGGFIARLTAWAQYRVTRFGEGSVEERLIDVGNVNRAVEFVIR